MTKNAISTACYYGLTRDAALINLLFRGDFISADPEDEEDPFRAQFDKQNTSFADVLEKPGGTYVKHALCTLIL